MIKTKYSLLILLFFIAFITGCEDMEEVEQPNYKVTVVSNNIQVGDTVEFKVQDAPDFLLFYSGSFGHEYKHRNRTSAKGTVTMSFDNAQKWGLKDNAFGTLSVWASTDYSGSGTVEGIEAATWTEITDRFNIDNRVPYTYLPWFKSGEADITDLEMGKPVYLAIKFYAVEHAGTGHRQPEWRIDNFTVKMTVEGAPGPFTVANEIGAGFKQINAQGEKVKLGSDKWRNEWFPYNGGWRLVGGSTSNEDWLITKPLNLTKVDPDKGVPLKTFSEKLETFTHVYDKPGTYTITFVGNNTTIYDSKEQVQELSIVVLD
ncbi:MAG: DUF5017 domain-containing protein [Carboxylicivirga sp.]|jgi:plastocyanin|nr:DUF5017 domain-containing protein [Carboxylicivirga sp.]